MVLSGGPELWAWLCRQPPIPSFPGWWNYRLNVFLAALIRYEVWGTFVVLGMNQAQFNDPHEASACKWFYSVSSTTPQQIGPVAFQHLKTLWESNAVGRRILWRLMSPLLDFQWFIGLEQDNGRMGSYCCVSSVVCRSGIFSLLLFYVIEMQSLPTAVLDASTPFQLKFEKKVDVHSRDCFSFQFSLEIGAV
jgi:hypothetical protein